MDPSEEISKFQEFFEQNLYDELLERVRTGKQFIVIDFPELAKFNPELADNLLENPEDTVEAAEVAVERFDLEDIEDFKVRFREIPKSQHHMIRDIRSHHIDKLIQIEGIVRQKTDVRPQVTSAKFECPSCGNVINVKQVDSKFKSPNRCSCGRKGKFRLLNKELVDTQKIVLEESPEDLEGGDQPKRLNIYMKNDLVSPMSEKRTNPGSRVIVIGKVEEIPITTSTGAQSVRFDLIMESNYVEPVQEDYTQMEIDDETVQEVKELAKDPNIFDRLVESIAPKIYGHERVKQALVLQMMGGVMKTRKKGALTRGDIHVLLIGDPGAGKSALLKRVSDTAPKARYVSGPASTAAGITASVVKDEFLRGYALEAGAMVLANKGICCTTGDSKFIKADGEKMSFEELFEDAESAMLKPEFEVMALNEETQKIEPHEVKQALMIKNNKKIYKITTRTGREITLTEDNEVLICENSDLKWKQVNKIQEGEHIGVPKKAKMNLSDKYSRDFSYIAGLIASDGSIKKNSKNARTAFYNSNKKLVELFQEIMEHLGYDNNVYVEEKGRTSTIRGEKITQRKDVYSVYNSKKEFAKELIEFGIPKGNKSSEKSLSDKLLQYSDKTIASFLRGFFDGDGSLRFDPLEATFTTGLKKNASLIQELLTRLGIVSSVRESTNCWRCKVRGKNNLESFMKKIGALHPEKFKKMKKAIVKDSSTKDRIDILPNHKELFQKVMKEKKGQLGKSKYKYFWNYAKKGGKPSKTRLEKLNKGIEDEDIKKHTESDVLWDRVEEIEEIEADYVYDFTMENTNNFVANNTIMHNCVDELDKMTQEDRAAMHEALEQQTVTVTKANIQATLKAQTTLLAAANPKFGRFDPYELLAKQIDLPSTLINRFDLIFPIRDLPDEKKDKKMASFMLEQHQKSDEDMEEINPDLLRDYVAYARQNVNPVLMETAAQELQDYFVKMRNSATDESEGIKAIPVSARQLEALVRLAEASARSRLSEKVTKDDAKRAIDLLHYTLSQIGMDPETGQIDIDRISTGTPASQRSQIHIIRDIINKLQEENGSPISYEDVVQEAELQDISEDKVEEIINKLKRSGDIFEPTHGKIQKL